MTFPSAGFREFHALHQDQAILRQESIYDPIIARVAELNPYHLLDLGCGTGELTAQLSGYCTKITAIDPSYDAIEIARRSSCTNVEFLVGDLSILEINESFDCVVCSMVINSVEVIETFLDSLAKRVTHHSEQIWTMLHPAFSFNNSIVMSLKSSSSSMGTVTFDPNPGYFSENRYSKDLGGCTLIEYHRPLSAIFSLMQERGFTLRNLEEPVPKTHNAPCQTLARIIPKVLVLTTWFAGFRGRDHEWIGVDLDGTLARFDYWRGPEHIGEPIWPMVRRVREWLSEGRNVRIFTSRVNNPKSIPAINSWCVKHFGMTLDVTNMKDEKMVELWDDRAVRVIRNEGVSGDG